MNIFPDKKIAAAEVMEEAQGVASNSSMHEVVAEIKEGVIAHILFSIASFLVIFSFLFFWWTGANLEVSNWSASDKMAGFMAAFIATAIAYGQYSLYKQGLSLKLIIISKVGILMLCVIADIGVNLDREDVRVERLSSQSPVLQAMLETAKAPISVQNSLTPSYVVEAMREKQDAMVWINSRCNSKHRRSGKDRIVQCKEFEEGRMLAAKETIESYQAMASGSAAAATSAAMEKRNDLFVMATEKEKDPGNHHALVRLAINLFDLAPITAATLVSMIIMIPLELLFVSNGKALKINRMALNIMTKAQGANNNIEENQGANDEFLEDLRPDAQPNNKLKEWNDVNEEVKRNKIASMLVLEAIADGEITGFSERIITDFLKGINYGKSNPDRLNIYKHIEDEFAKEKRITMNKGWVIPPEGEGHKNGSMKKWIISHEKCLKDSKFGRSANDAQGANEAMA